MLLNNQLALLLNKRLALLLNNQLPRCQQQARPRILRSESQYPMVNTPQVPVCPEYLHLELFPPVEGFKLFL
jgi:hypothetical protein